LKGLLQAGRYTENRLIVPCIKPEKIITMSYELNGKLHKIYPAENKTDTFQTREFVVATQENYPQFIKLQLTQDRCAILDNYKEGEDVKVFFDLRGREWNDKYFTNLQAWKMEKLSEQDASPGADMPADGFDDFSEEDHSDLPF
jgi:single-strand DNA-binding protein